MDLAWPGGPGDVLVRLRAAALNPADIFFRQLGGYLDGPAPFVLGHDGMGVVEAVGNAVTAVKPGDRVCFCNGGIGGSMGTYAEAAVVPEFQLAKVPDESDDLTAAALPLVSITCWELLHVGRACSPASSFSFMAAPAALAMWRSSLRRSQARGWRRPSAQPGRPASFSALVPRKPSTIVKPISPTKP